LSPVASAHKPSVVTLTARVRRTTVDWQRWRGPLLWLAAVRTALSVIAIPLAPVLYEDHFVVLVLLRPTKEVLLAGGFLVREGTVHPLELLLAAVPLTVFGVWHFYALGRAYRKEIAKGKVPGLGGRVLPVERISKLRKVLAKRGTKIVVLGRLAAFPSTLVAAAAGASKMPSRTFMQADGAGAMLSLVEVVGAGILLGSAYRSAGPWITAAGVAALLAMLWVAGRYLRRE
jgi:membrane protein DedA with SNARE-associated domain